MEISKITPRPAGLKTITVKHTMTEAKDCRFEWAADFGKMEMNIYVPFISPALLSEFFFSLRVKDERFEKTKIRSAIQISNLFKIKLCVTHEEFEVWYNLRVYKLESLTGIATEEIELD